MLRISLISCSFVWMKGTGMSWLLPTLLIKMDISSNSSIAGFSFSRLDEEEEASLTVLKSKARVLTSILRF